MIRLNMNEAVVPESFGNRVLGIGGDMNAVVNGMIAELRERSVIADSRILSQDVRLDYLVEALKYDSDDYKTMYFCLKGLVTLS